MFGTFRYNETTKDHEHIKLSSADGVDARGYTLVACDFCRARKLKCSGDRDGCGRCQASSSTCTYTSSSAARVGRKRLRRSSIPASRGSSPDAKRATTRRNAQRHSTDARPRPETAQGRAPASASSKASGSVSRSAPSPSASMTAVEPPSSCSDLSWDTFDEFRMNAANVALLRPDDPYGFAQGLMIPGVDGNAVFDAVFLDGAHSPIPSGSAAALDWNCALAAAPEDRGTADQPEPDTWNWRVDFTHQQPEQTKQVHESESRLGSAPALCSERSASSVSAGKDCCKCLSTMAQLLEDVGVQGPGASTEAPGVDTLLMCLGRGTKTCSEVLACAHCNACADNAMLVATIAQQLGATAKTVASRLWVHQEGRDRDVNGGPPWQSKTDKKRGVAEMLEGAILFGRYRIELPEMRFRLVYNVVLLHLTDLQTLLSHIKDRIGPKRGAWRLLADAEDKAVKVCWMIRQLSKRGEGV